MDSKDCVKRQAVTFTEAGKTGQDWDGGMSEEEGWRGGHEKCKFHCRHVEIEMPVRP